MEGGRYRAWPRRDWEELVAVAKMSPTPNRSQTTVLGPVGEQKERMDVLRQAVENSASSWKTPTPAKNAEGRYGGRLAKAQVKKWHPRAQVRSAFLSRASWKIHKNPLGVILRRTLPGYVLFKLPKEPYCQLRPFTLAESYAGGGKYQKATKVGIGYVRFQDC